jgi:hypothetical protein
MPLPTARFHYRLDRAHKALAPFAIMVVTACLSTAAAHPAGTGSHPTHVRDATLTWGAGPMTASIADITRNEGPLPDVERERAPQVRMGAPAVIPVAYPTPAIH